ncbi:MAG: HAD-IA family hydrolase [Roseibium sp.]|uniref:HAD family hydrolase n=1 Tax=Roseibium sp. TaxID=1936156 RepID=UPI00261E0C45|nr:HAD-IA family hydrolase [Roseibium sp.]MCV0429358.1 HAD-IA family hydrolase [Roseibium sp.]
MRNDIKAIAWDFDGVLNRNIAEGRFLWSDTLEEDLGISLRAFQEGVFNDTFIDVLSGKLDLLHHVQSWLDQNGHEINGEALLSYWFAKDDLKDPQTNELLDHLSDQGIVQVIATNNEDRRATYIESETGYETRVSAVFAAGRMGLVKPDPAFFIHIQEKLGLAPKNILLVDDSASNVRAARSLGWNAFHFTDETRSELARYLGI